MIGVLVSGTHDADLSALLMSLISGQSQSQERWFSHTMFKIWDKWPTDKDVNFGLCLRQS